MHALGWIGVALLVLWGILWLGLQIVSGLVHLLVVIGIALIIYAIVKKGTDAARSRL